MKRNQVNLELNNNVSAYSQIGQTKNIYYSFLNRVEEGFKEICYPIRCREIVGDAAISGMLDVPIFGMGGLYLEDERSVTNETLISITMNYNCYDIFMKHERIIREFEKIMGIPLKDRTKFYPTQHNTSTLVRPNRDGDQVVVVVGPKEWMSSPLMNSWYTALLRMICYASDRPTIAGWLNRNKHTSGNDEYIFQMLNDPAFNYKLFFSRYKEVLGDNPITGLNDAAVLEKVDMFRDGNYPNRSVRISYNLGDESVEDVQYSIGLNHSYHGLYSSKQKFSAIRNYINNPTPDTLYHYNMYKKTVGFLWVHNYCNILKNEGVNE